MLNNTRTLQGCNVLDLAPVGQSVNFNNLTVDYYAKTLSPHLSTFDAVIDCDTALDGSAVLTVPDYIGIIKLNASAPVIISDFTTIPTFKRLLTAGGPITTATFDINGTFVLPSPSITTVIKNNNLDFIEFLYNVDAGVFKQTASVIY